MSKGFIFADNIIQVWKLAQSCSFIPTISEQPLQLKADHADGSLRKVTPVYPTQLSKYARITLLRLKVTTK